MELLKATRIAVGIGEIFAIFLFFYGLFFNPWLALIAIFIYLGAEGEKRTTELKVTIADVPVKAAMLTEVESITSETTLGEVLEKMCHKLQQDFPIIEGNKVSGIFSHEKIFSALHYHSKDTRIGEIMSQEFISTSEDAPLSEAFKRMTSEKLSVLPVMQGENFKGLISLEQIGKYHMLCGLSR